MIYFEHPSHPDTEACHEYINWRKNMKVLVVGSGGREHALIWKLAQSPKVTTLYAAPGNPGTENFAHTAPLQAGDIKGIVAFAEREAADLVVVGPEAPLSLGLADLLKEKGIPCFGPGARGTLLESSKKYARDFMTRHGIPAPAYRAFTDIDAAKQYVETQPEAPLVVKADGLAQGKGVIVARDRREALAAVGDMMGSGRFGEAGKEILIEECLTGEEVSLLTFTDGKTILPMLPVQDHKRIGEGDTGPNTGGMGTYSPVTIFTREAALQIETNILNPIRKAFQAGEIDYRGCLYVGLMMTPDGPKVIEFNARFGDPETQVLMPLLESDLFEILYACARGELHEKTLKWQDATAVCVVMASRGYPGEYTKGQIIEELPVTKDLQEHSWVFHAGTARNAGGQLTTAGGRVLSITARGRTLEEALERAYSRVGSVHFEGQTFRKDIAARELRRRKKD